MGSLVPYRVDLFDDEIDSIRTFDPDSQRSLYPVPEVRLLPGREFPMDDDARAKFRSRWRELLEGDPTKSRIYKDMGAGVATAGIEYYLPLFFEETATVFDYLGPDAPPWCCMATWNLPSSAFGKTPRTATVWCKATPSARRCRPKACFWAPSSSMPPNTNAHAIKSVAASASSTSAQALTPHVCGARTPYPPWPPSAAAKTRWPAESPRRNTQHRMLVLAESDGRRESLLDFLRASGVNPPVI
jgi:transcription-repair coupling factor (superfamily II helicase)